MNARTIFDGWSKLTSSMCQFGAADTEPDYAFQRTILAAITENRNITPGSAAAWSLFRKPGRGAVAKKLTAFTKTTVRAIRALPEDELQKFEQQAAPYLWRVS